MKMRVSDYIVKTLELNGIDTSFSITGGFAMHLNDSFGRSNFKVHYQHHEQACGYSAVGYTKDCGKPSVVCTTAGCAATNTISPCLVAYQDSVPVLFISGQVKSNETIRSTNTESMKLRHYAGADCDIISAVSEMTKYSHEVTNVSEIPSVMMKAIENLVSGRPGPVWLSIPVDIQGMQIDNDLKLYSLPKFENEPIDLSSLYECIQASKRPLLLLGNGVKLAGCQKQLQEFLTKYPIPCVVTMLSTDLLETNHPMNFGKVGLIGDRHGNFTLQNCDLLISLGCRMAQGIVGYRADWFAREAKVIYIDNDANELKKTNIQYHMKVNADVRTFFHSFQATLPNYSDWIAKCDHWKSRWLFETPSISESEQVNPYIALKCLYSLAPENKTSVVSSGSIVTNVWHMINVKKNDTFVISSQGDMGFELPAAIGCQIASPDKLIISILGEGSLQLNIQELQTILQYKLPIKILVFNNASYGAIVITQKNFFNAKFGVDVSSGISFPSTEKIVNAYGIKYDCIQDYSNMEDKINQFINYDGAILLEVFCSIQSRHPRLSAIKNEDGTFTNRPFEDMFPFLEREDLKNEMIVSII
jgi:acetolactate synthase-1/2/3 large subunit